MDQYGHSQQTGQLVVARGRRAAQITRFVENCIEKRSVVNQLTFVVNYIPQNTAKLDRHKLYNKFECEPLLAEAQDKKQANANASIGNK